MLAEGNERWHAGSPGPFRGWKGQTYEGGVRVPCIARWPGRIPEGRVRAGVSSVLDLLPTAVAIAGGTLPDDRRVDGLDIQGLLMGEVSPREELVHFRGRRAETVRRGPWKLRVEAARGDEAPVSELFHLLRDPGERFNVADRYPDIVEDLQERLTEVNALAQQSDR
jgi:uncharacterized sulfatase